MKPIRVWCLLTLSAFLLVLPGSVLSGPAAVQADHQCLTAKYEKRHMGLLKRRTAANGRFTLRCHYVTNDEAVQTRPVAAPYFDATSEAGEIILMKGREEDGFFVPEDIASFGCNGFGRARQTYPVSREIMEKLCTETIASRFSYQSTLERPYLWTMTAQIFPPERRRQKGYTLRFPQDRKMIVLFGDSISDNGNLYYFLASRLLGLYYTPDRPYFFGQFTNRFVWNEYATRPKSTVAEEFRPGLIDAAPAQPRLWGHGFRTRRGGNPATPVGHDRPNRCGPSSRPCGNVDDMVAVYVESVAENAIDNPDDTIFVLFFGANDFDNFVNKRNRVLMFRRPSGPVGYETISDAGVADHIAAVEKLLAAGAKNILIMDVPNLGITPMVLLADGFLKCDTD